MLRDQYQLVLLDEERAVRALPKLLRAGEPDADAALDALRELLTAPGPLSKDGEEPARKGREDARRQADEGRKRRPAMKPASETGESSGHEKYRAPDRRRAERRRGSRSPSRILATRSPFAARSRRSGSA